MEHEHEQPQQPVNLLLQASIPDEISDQQALHYADFMASFAGEFDWNENTDDENIMLRYDRIMIIISQSSFDIATKWEHLNCRKNPKKTLFLKGLKRLQLKQVRLRRQEFPRTQRIDHATEHHRALQTQTIHTQTKTLIYPTFYGGISQEEKKSRQMLNS